MKIDREYELFVQDLVMRLVTLPGFRPVNGEIEKACQHAFSVAEKFFPRWQVEKSRLTEALAKLPESLKNASGDTQEDSQGPAKGNGRVKASKGPGKAPAKEKRAKAKR